MSYEHLKEWIGRQDEHLDLAALAPLTGLAATLDHDAGQIFSGSVDFIRSVVADIRQGSADSATASQKGATDE